MNRSLLVLAFGGGLAACGSSEPMADEEPPIPAELRLAPDTLRFSRIGETLPLSARVLHERGDPIADAEGRLNAGDTLIATILPGGFVRVEGNGRTLIGASYWLLIDTIFITVRTPDVDSNTIAFRTTDIHTMRGDGSNVSKTSCERRLYTSDLVWAPDGNAILYEDTHHLVLSSIDGLIESRLTLGGNGYEPAWSPSGERIAFVSGRDGRFRLWTVRRDGSQPNLIDAGRWRSTVVSRRQPDSVLGQRPERTSAGSLRCQH